MNKLHQIVEKWGEHCFKVFFKIFQNAWNVKIEDLLLVKAMQTRPGPFYPRCATKTVGLQTI